MNYYQRLRDIREDNDLTQAQVAEILNIKQTQYSRYERGAAQMSIDRYIILAKHYNVSLDYITGIIDEPKKIFFSNHKK